MTGRRLARCVYVRDDRGNPHVFGPRDDIPEWAEQKITNPRAWAADGDGLPASSPRTEQSEPAGVPIRGTGSAPEPAPSRTGPTVGSVQTIESEPRPEPPPRGGKGSGAAAWRAYAEQMDVQVAPDAERDDVITELESRGIRVE